MRTLLSNFKLGDFYNWWIGELASILSISNNSLYKKNNEGLTLRLSKNSYSFKWINNVNIIHSNDVFDSDKASQIYQDAVSDDRKLRESKINLDLTDIKILQRTIILPASTEDNLNQVIVYEMDRYTPFKAEDVYFDVKIVERNNLESKITIILSVIKKSQIDEVIEFAKKSSLSITSIFSSLKHDSNQIQNYAFIRDIKSLNTKSQSVNNWLIGLAVTLAFLALIIPIMKNHWHSNQYEKAIKSMSIELDQVKKIAGEYHDFKRDIDYLQNLNANQTRVLDLLNELTKLIPDDTSLTKITLDNGIIRLRGNSDSSSKLISILDASKMFRGVRFTAPITQHPNTGKESFAIEIDLNSDDGNS